MKRLGEGLPSCKTIYMHVKNLGFWFELITQAVCIKCSGQLPIWLLWTQPSGGREGSVMHSWGNSSSLPTASCKRGAEHPDLAAVMLRQSSGNAAGWVSPFNTSWADFLTGAQGLRGLRLCDHGVGAHAAQSSASFQRPC